jgi:hypothetical protein
METYCLGAVAVFADDLLSIADARITADAALILNDEPFNITSKRSFITTISE